MQHVENQLQDEKRGEAGLWYHKLRCFGRVQP